MSFDTIELEGFAGGGEIGVPCDRIDAELDAIWRGIAKRSQIAVHRACLLNLIVHAGDPASEIVARYLATSLVDRLPARVLVVRARPHEAGEGEPRAFVAASRHPVREGSGGSSQVSGELVLIDARGAQLDRVPAVLRAALEPDLATTLWWTGPAPPPRSYVAALRDLAERVIVDSEELPDDADVSHLLPPDAAGRIADLTWPRLEPWRVAVARAFDEPQHRSFLAGLDAVTVGLATHGAQPPDASAVPLLAGWLASTLGWRECARSPDGRSVCWTAPGGASRVRIVGEARRSDLRGIVDVTLTAGDRVLVFRRSARGLVEAQVPPGFRPIRPARFRDVDPVDALARTLLEIHADPVAPDAIRRAAEIGTALAR